MQLQKTDATQPSTRDMLNSLTNGRPYAFLIMSYKAEHLPVYDIIARTLRDNFGVVCVRADEVPSSGFNLLSKIHDIIADATLVLAEISEPSPNVYYEIGYAVKAGKPPLLIVKSGTEIPTDLKGLETIEYTNRLGAEREFTEKLLKHLPFRLKEDLTLLDQMLVAIDPFPAYIVSSPKLPTKLSRKAGQVFDRRTFGDNLGIRGLFTAFGSLFGPNQAIELLSASYSADDLSSQDLNLYLIGSRKVNPVLEKPVVDRDCPSPSNAKSLFELLQGVTPLWEFRNKDPSMSEDGDWPVGMYRRTNGEWKLLEGGQMEVPRDAVNNEVPVVWQSDYGLILRAPHPKHPMRLVLALAGAHSLGTGAACVAATNPAHIKLLRSKLPEGTLSDKSKSFWVLVRGTASVRDSLLDAEGVEILEAGLFES